MSAMGTRRRRSKSGGSSLPCVVDHVAAIPDQEAGLGALGRPRGQGGGVPLDGVEDIDHAGGERLAADLGKQRGIVDFKPAYKGADLVVVVPGHRLGQLGGTGTSGVHGHAEDLPALAASTSGASVSRAASNSCKAAWISSPRRTSVNGSVKPGGSSGRSGASLVRR